MIVLRAILDGVPPDGAAELLGAEGTEGVTCSVEGVVRTAGVDVVDDLGEGAALQPARDSRATTIQGVTERIFIGVARYRAKGNRLDVST